VQQLPLAIGLGPQIEATFDNFRPGPNAAVVAQLRAQADPTVPLFLWGPPGSGKTHLLRAMVHEHRQRGERAGWFDAVEPAPWADDPGRRLLVFDDCERFDDAQQHEAFTLFIEAAQRGILVAAAATMPAVDLPIREDLRTRLGWGLGFALKPLPEAEVHAVLRQEAADRGIDLGDDVARYLLTRFDRDLKSLVRLLERLDAYSLAQKRAVTVPLIRQMLSDPSPPWPWP
jgi:DnaA-homolog protein